MPRTGLDDRPTGFEFPRQATVRQIYEYWHYGMGRASSYSHPLKDLQSRWTPIEQKRRAQAKALIEFFNGVIPPNADL